MFHDLQSTRFCPKQATLQGDICKNVFQDRLWVDYIWVDRWFIVQLIKFTVDLSFTIPVHAAECHVNALSVAAVNAKFCHKIAADCHMLNGWIAVCLTELSRTHPDASLFTESGIDVLTVKEFVRGFMGKVVEHQANTKLCKLSTLTWRLLSIEYKTSLLFRVCREFLNKADLHIVSIFCTKRLYAA